MPRRRWSAADPGVATQAIETGQFLVSLSGERLGLAFADRTVVWRATAACRRDPFIKIAARVCNASIEEAVSALRRIEYLRSKDDNDALRVTRHGSRGRIDRESNEPAK